MSEKKLPTGITLRKDGRYQWRFKYDGVTYSGYARKLPDAKKALNDKRYEVEHGLSSKEQAIIMDAWFPEWLRLYKENHCKESTVENYRNTYNRYIKPKFGRMQLKKIRTEALQSLLTDLSKTYSRGLVSLVYDLLCGAFKQAKKAGLVSRDPMENVDKPKGKEPRKKRALSEENERQFLEAAKKSKYYRLYRLASLTGMRIGEALGLQWDDIDFDKSEIHINHTLSRSKEKGFYLSTPKSESSRRVIPIDKNGEAYKLLNEQRKAQLYQKLRAGVYWDPPKGFEDLVFSTEHGTPVYDASVQGDKNRIIAKLKKQGIDIGDFSFHTLRHCFATRCIENGMDPKTLQAILGHSTFSMTMDLYVDVMESQKRSEMERISEAL